MSFKEEVLDHSVIYPGFKYQLNDGCEGLLVRDTVADLIYRGSPQQKIPGS